MLGKAILQRDMEVACVRITNGIIRVTSDEILRVLKAVIRVSQDQTHRTSLSIQVFLSVCVSDAIGYKRQQVHIKLSRSKQLRRSHNNGA